MREWMDPMEITKDPKKPHEKSRRYEFVLMELKVKCARNGKERRMVGWWNGHCWEGGRLATSDNVLSWKRRYGA